ncbi:MAG: glycerol-3-phosphate 1-O-acyltransferase PlsB [Pseudomonadota bacterium]
MKRLRRIFYRLNRRLVSFVARPQATGTENIPHDKNVVYVIPQRALTDLIVLDLVANDGDIPSPLSEMQSEDVAENTRFFPLLRASSGRITMRLQSPRMTRLVEAPGSFQAQTVLVPTSIFWGRAMANEGSWLGMLTSEHWAVTGRIKRLLNLFLNRRNILVSFGRPIELQEVCAEAEANVASRRLARLLRVRLRQQKERTLGPDFSHRRTLIQQVLESRSVRDAIDREVANGRRQKRVERQAQKYVHTLASDMSSPTIRILSRLLSWFWNKIYSGIELQGLEQLTEITDTHTLVYVPSHRSHLDYLLLSYLLYYRGLMIPHIAAGDNLNLPILGSILRRGGAFFIRRSFRGDALYVAVFEEYLYHVYRKGHCVEFFPEGGRSRTGRLLPAKFGMLKMSVNAHHRGLPKPLAFVPVYFSYEKLVEAGSYLSELRGAEKRQESVFDVFKNLNLIRQDFGRVVVSIGAALPLDQWLQTHRALDADQQIQQLADEIMVQINQNAYVNPVNLVALATLAMPKQAMEESLLLSQIGCYQKLLALPEGNQRCDMSPAEDVVTYTESLSLLERESHPFGDVLGHDPKAAILMTWYRNNVLHTLALPALVGCLIIRRRRGLPLERLSLLVNRLYPYLAKELSSSPNAGDLDELLERMHTLGLIQVKAGAVSAPASGTLEYQQLELLSNLVSQTLERMYIVVFQVSHAAMERRALQTASHTIAQKISRLYGINAPEFADARLFNLFIDGLLERQAIMTDPDGKLRGKPIIDEVLRAAEHVIEPQIRLGVAAASQQA